MESTDSRWISVEGSKRIVTIAVAPCTGQTVEKSYLPLNLPFQLYSATHNKSDGRRLASLLP